eukprot:32858-Amphidinium_carterae.1
MSCDLADARRCCRPASEAQMLAGQHVFDAVRGWCRSDGHNPSDGGLSQLVAFLSHELEGEDLMTKLDAYAEVSADRQEFEKERGFDLPPSTLELSAGHVALPKVAGHIILEPPALPETLSKILKEEHAFAKSHPPEKLEPCFTSVASWPDLALELLER